MALLEKLPDSSLGLRGATPSKLPGASALNDVHVQKSNHVAGHTKLDLGRTPSKYTDNLSR